jgi:phosphate transport system substrate-binding protein
MDFVGSSSRVSHESNRRLALGWSLAWRSKGQGSVELILEHLNLKHEQIGPHVNISSNSDAIKSPAGDDHAIALASVGVAERYAQAGVPIKVVAYNGVPATTDAIHNHTYALARPLMLVTHRLPEGLQKRFIDFALSREVIDLQVKHGFVPYQE